MEFNYFNGMTQEEIEDVLANIQAEEDFIIEDYLNR